MQAISLMSLAAGQAAPAPAQGGSQTATAANAGLFQGMLLEALLGGQISPELAAQLQTVPQSADTANGQAAAKAPEGGQLPGVLLNGPTPVGIAPTPAPDAQAATPAPETAQPQTQTQPQTRPQPATTQPQVTVHTEILPPVPLVAETAAETPAQPAAPKPKDAPETQQQPTTPDAVLAQVLMQGQAAVPQPAAQSQPAAPAPQTAAPAVVADQATADPQLEAFVQRAVKLAQGEQPEAPAVEAKAPAGPTFQDLVKLVAGADQAGGPKAETQQSAQNQQPKAQTQPHPTLQAVPEQHDPAPAPVKAPKAAESPEKLADVNLAQAPRPAVHEASTAAPDAPQAAPRQTADPEQVLRQVSRFVKVMVDSKQSEVRLQLHPDNLGSVGVRLVLGDGALKANLTAQDASVKAVLEANLDQLKSRLADQGFQVEQVHVTVGGGDGFGQPQHSRQGEQRQPQQPWRSQARSWQEPQAEESSPRQYQQRTTPTWFLKGTGARINSLA